MKIVITGGPGGGKTTALDLFRRELLGKVAVVPESATAIFSGGVKRDNQTDILKAIQKIIFDHQKNIEYIYDKQNPNKILLCDRGTLDGLAYWPGTEESFFEQMDSTYEEELSQYDAVIFFETAAQNGSAISSNNPYRNESHEKAVELDLKLQKIWKKHHNYFMVRSKTSFIEKIIDGVNAIKKAVG